ncbi:MAG: carboxymuconolactone decarboxylase family protein [Planctomycetota bacterium]|jgi:AhpD family alkylhydroperoxidase
MKEKLDSSLISKLNDFTDDFLSEQDGVLDRKTIELVATAVSICVDCSPCTDFHIIEAVKHGATGEEINKVFKIVMAVSAGKRKVFSRGLKSDF